MAGIDPSVLVAPDYQTQMLQAQHRLALAQALQQQAMTDTPGNGGTVSWTQGLARVLDGLFAGSTANKGYKQMEGANHGYARGMWQMFHQGQPYPGDAQTAQGAPPQAPGTPAPPMPPQAPQGAPQGAPLADNPAIANVSQGQPVAPPQAASPPPSAPPPSAPTGGAPNPMSLTGNGDQDMATYMMAGPEEYGKALIGAHAPTDFAKSLAQSGIDPNSPTGRQLMQAMVAHQLYQAPVSFRPGGWSQDASGKLTYHPQSPAPGAMPVMDANGQPTGAWSEDPSASNIQAHQAGAVAGAQAGAKAPYDTVQTFNPNTGQMEIRPKSDVTGGGALNSYYSGQAGGHAGGQSSGGHALPSGPSLGQQEAFGQYAKHSADAFAQTQGIADSSPQRVQSLREMQSLISGPNALTTGPTAAKVQQMAEEHGLTFLAKDNAFVFNKDAARFVAQSAQDLGLNGSDNRLGMMANASPNMKMTPQALKTVIPTMVGLEYAKMAKATAASNWAQRDPGGNAKFESRWRQNYDPRMFTAYAEGGPQALAKAPPAQRQQWLRDYRNLKAMGVNFGQFAQ